MSDKDRLIEDAPGCLMAYAVEWLAEWSGQDPAPLPAGLPAGASQKLAPYRQLLAGAWQVTEPGTPLLSIFSRVKAKEDGTGPPERYWLPQPLSLAPVAPVDEATARAADLAALWQGFKQEAGRVLELPADSRFEAFTHLLHKWAWAVPCRYGEPGVSLYDEFRALSALVHASRCAEQPADKFLLVGGDIPGIQDFVYTITSKGAAKGLRGRSFFVQLLGDAVVRRLLADLGLPETNVVYAAGGNFVLLAPAGVEAEKTEETVRRVRQQVNARLVEAIQGDTALVLETMELPAGDLFVPDLFRDKRGDLAGRVAWAKSQPLRELADDWPVLFEPKGKGSKLSCAVCHVEVDAHNSKPLEPAGELPEPPEGGPERAEPPRICHLCASFGDLAHDIRHQDLWMAVREATPMLGAKVEPKDGWTRLLERMTGFQYEFSGVRPDGGGLVLAANQPEFLQAGAHGFRLLANITPVVTPDDLKYLSEKEKVPEKEMPKEGDIRSFTLLAHAAAAAGAIERVGVLRMDVDGLGWVFSDGVPDLTLPKLGALSRLIDLFFGGCLNRLVQEQGDNDLYIIYAGGDDLFVVGAWHRLPGLAEAVHDRFQCFTGDNRALSLSGGITLEGAKFPLYRSAERAAEAEGKSKGYTRADGRKKDALCFLDTVVGWEDWALVRRQKDELLWLVGEDEENKAKKGDRREQRLPRALLQIVQSIHQLYRTGLRDTRRQVREKNRRRPAGNRLPLPRPQAFYGRWVWMKVYSLTRLAKRSERETPAAPERIKALQEKIMQPETVRYSGLAARWAEYQTRKEANS